jgi:lactate 2-monooxygenase
MASALDWQKEIYLGGVAGQLPAVPVDFQKLEHAARGVLSPRAFAYVAGGAGREETAANNVSAFSRYQIIQRMLKNVGERDTTVRIFGQLFPSPFLLAPIGVLDLFHPDADLAVARAAARLGTPMIFSNQASQPMEACASCMGDSPRWFQLYWSKSKDLISSFVNRAERCGCTAIVLTLDTTMLGWRTRDLDLAYLPFLEGRGIAQYSSDPVFQKMMDEPAEGDPVKQRITMQSIQALINMVNRYPGKNFFSKLRSKRPVLAVRKFISTYSNPCTTWEDLKFLRQQTRLPIVLKGIVHKDDALRAMDAGMNGIIVSNHGGRQVDGAIGTLDALPAVAEAVQKKIPLIIDSGIRGGADAFKALALGADAVCIGRPYVYGLALAGERGVYEVVRNYMADFELTMALAGCKHTLEIQKEMIIGR